MTNEIFENGGKSELLDTINRVTDNLQTISFINHSFLETTLSELEEKTLTMEIKEPSEYLDSYKSRIAEDVLKPAGILLVEPTSTSIDFIDKLSEGLSVVYSAGKETVEELDSALNMEGDPVDKLYYLIKDLVNISITDYYELIDVSENPINKITKHIESKLASVTHFDQNLLVKAMGVLSRKPEYAKTLLYKHIMDGTADELYSFNNESDINLIEEELIERLGALHASFECDADTLIDEIAFTHLVYSTVPRTELVSSEKLASIMPLELDFKDIELRLCMVFQKHGVNDELS